MSGVTLKLGGPRCLWLALGLLVCALLSGCETYQLQGCVISGPESHIEVVDADDARLVQPGIPNVRIQPTLDPQSLEPKTVAAGLSGPEGRFTIPITEPGAGLLEFDLGVVCRLKGQVMLEETLPLPSRHKRLLIILGAGSGKVPGQDDILHDTMKMGQELEKH